MKLNSKLLMNGNDFKNPARETASFVEILGIFLLLPSYYFHNMMDWVSLNPSNHYRIFITRSLSIPSFLLVRRLARTY